MHRVLRHYKAHARRDGVRPVVKRHMPTSYEATGPNQVWTWGITYLRDAEHSTRFYDAFVVIASHSRYMVNCDDFEAETDQNAVRFLSEAMDKHYIRPRCLVLHSDNGAAMKAAETLGLLAVRVWSFLTVGLGSATITSTASRCSKSPRKCPHLRWVLYAVVQHLGR